MRKVKNLQKPIENEIKIGNYILGKELGSGGFGKVYEAKKIGSNDKVAFKITSQKDFDSTSAFNLEHPLNKDLINLSHENLVRLIDKFQGRNKDEYCLVYEYCDGGNLEDFIYNQKGKKLSYSEVQYIIKELVKGSEFLEKHNLVHRDIKPTNIMIQKSENGVCTHVKLGDYGTCRKQAEDMTHIGSAPFVAPEVISNFGSYTSVCDIWSIGVTLCSLLTGFPKNFNYDTSKNVELLTEKEYPPECLDFINGCLQMDRDKRFTWNEVFYHPFIYQSTLFKINKEGKEAVKLKNKKYIVDILERHPLIEITRTETDYEGKWKKLIKESSNKNLILLDGLKTLSEKAKKRISRFSKHEKKYCSNIIKDLIDKLLKTIKENSDILKEEIKGMEAKKSNEIDIIKEKIESLQIKIDRYKILQKENEKPQVEKPKLELFNSVLQNLNEDIVYKYNSPKYIFAHLEKECEGIVHYKAGKNIKSIWLKKDKMWMWNVDKPLNSNWSMCTNLETNAGQGDGYKPDEVYQSLITWLAKNNPEFPQHPLEKKAGSGSFVNLNNQIL